MPSANIYCAICGGPFRGIRTTRNKDERDAVDVLFGGEDVGVYDGDYMSSVHYSWTSSMVVLMNRENTISGKSYLFYGAFTYTQGDGVPIAEEETDDFEDETIRTVGDRYWSKTTLYLYSRENFPFHAKCYTVLERAFAERSSTSKINLRHLNLYFTAHHDDDGPHCKFLHEYYGAAQFQHYNWNSQRGWEVLIAYPWKNDTLSRMLRDPPRLRAKAPEQQVTPTRTTKHIISQLPLEIADIILASLSPTDVSHTFFVFGDLGGTSWMWEQKFEKDMSYILPDLPLIRPRVDFKALYLAFAKMKGRQTYMGLSNYKRIATIAAEIAAMVSNPHEWMDSDEEGSSDEDSEGSTGDADDWGIYMDEEDDGSASPSDHDPDVD